jgi:hypothetical protein
MSRETVKCPHCRLNQFKTVSGDCRRCHKALVIVEAAVPVKPAVIIDSNFMLPPIGRKMDEAIALTSKTLRQAFNFSQKDAAARYGCPRSYFTKIENGTQSMTVPSIARLASTYDLSLGSFMQIIETVANGQ